MKNDKVKKAIGIIRIINAVIEAIVNVFRARKKNKDENGDSAPSL